MESVTIRKIPKELAEDLEARAEEEGTSLAKTVIRPLLRTTGLRTDGGRQTR